MTNGITVTGVGEVKAVPDIARIELTAETFGATVAEARDSAAAATNRLLESLKTDGVPAADLQTSRLSIQTQHEYPPNAAPIVTGYAAQNTVRVTLRDLEAAGGVIDRAMAAAGDSGRLQGINFAFSEPEALATEARRRAIGAALANARTFAQAAGVKVGKVLSIVEASPRGPEPRMLAMRLEAAPVQDTPIEAGESTIAISVVVTYAIKR